MIQRRLSQLMAAPSLADVSSFPSLRLSPLDGRETGRFAIEITKKAHLVVQPCDDPLPLTEDSELIASEVFALLIVRVEDRQ